MALFTNAGTLRRWAVPRRCRRGSMLSLALVSRELGDPVRARSILADVVERAPALWIDLVDRPRRDSGRRAFEYARRIEDLSDDETAELIERALRAMRGNRSASCLTFVDSGGRLRAIPPNGMYHFVSQREERAEIRSLVADWRWRSPSVAPAFFFDGCYASFTRMVSARVSKARRWAAVSSRPVARML